MLYFLPDYNLETILYKTTGVSNFISKFIVGILRKTPNILR